jgi:hypothetical protein
MPGLSRASMLPAKHPSESLEDEFVRLYWQREDIQARIEAIRTDLTDEQYQALVLRIEGIQVATLKKDRSDVP